MKKTDIIYKSNLRTKYFAVVGLLSSTLLGMEIIWTRIFSAEYFYTFAFLILSLAILGLGIGALSIRIVPKLNDEKKIGLYLILTTALTITGPPLIFLLGIDFAFLFSAAMMMKIFIAILILSLPYYFGGMILAILFRKYNAEISKVYMIDLASAGIGVVASVVLMQLIGTPKATFLISIPIIIGTILLKGKQHIVASVVLSAILIAMTFRAEDILEEHKQEPARVIHKHWDAMSKIKIYEYHKMFRGINIDNHASTTVVGFDGNFNKTDSMKMDIFEINIGYLIRRFAHCNFLAVGAGGGRDVMHALFEGASKVYAVEVNPYINYLMLEGELANFTGYIYKDPRVEVITEDARTFVRKFNSKFDIIFSFSSNSYAALASGAFALAENYIYTKEAFIDYWQALTDSGFVVMEHHFYIPRLVSELLEAAEELHLQNIGSYFAVYDLPEWRRQLLLISKKPLTEEIMQNAIGPLTPENHNVHLIYPAPLKERNNIIYKIINDGWESAFKDARIDISPASDDRPYTPQLGLWKNFSFDRLQKVEGFEEFFGFPLAKLIIVMILLIIFVIALPLVLLPYLKKGKKLNFSRWIYFFFIGIAFMMVEVILIQKYTLFIGPSVYSIFTVLFTLLIFSGLGSFNSAKIDYRIAFVGILLFIVLDVTLFKYLFSSFRFFDINWRIIITAIFIAPLGFFMGIPFPKGARLAGEMIDWGFAVNGVASVIGSTLIVLIAFEFGFTISLLLAAIVYVAAFIIYATQNKLIKN